MVTKASSTHEMRCPVTALLTLIGGKWKPVILYCLRSDTRRFGELTARIPTISRKVLTEQLKELEDAGLVVRQQFNETPPRVEYSLSEMGQSLAPVLNAMAQWGNEKLLEPREKTRTPSVAKRTRRGSK